jgi:hypothetical protein
MAIKVYSGKIQILSASTTLNATITTFSYIEMADGQLIKNISIKTALEGELRLAFDKGETVELHTNSTNHVFAIRHENGRTFSTTKIGLYVPTYIISLLAIAWAIMCIGFAIQSRNGEEFFWSAVFAAPGIFIARWGFASGSDIRECNQHLEILNPIYID